jgi:hypothetical protein
MSIDVLRRDEWTGKARQLGDLLRMRKGEVVATCELWTHQLGWECRLFAGDEEMIATQVCRTQREMPTDHEVARHGNRGYGREH